MDTIIVRQLLVLCFSPLDDYKGVERSGAGSVELMMVRVVVRWVVMMLWWCVVWEHANEMFRFRKNASSSFVPDNRRTVSTKPIT
jgi:hypothetical protein